MTSEIYSIACDFGSSGGKIFLSKFELLRLCRNFEF